MIGKKHFTLNDEKKNRFYSDDNRRFLFIFNQTISDLKDLQLSHIFILQFHGTVHVHHKSSLKILIARIDNTPLTEHLQLLL